MTRLMQQMYLTDWANPQRVINAIETAETKHDAAILFCEYVRRWLGLVNEPADAERPSVYTDYRLTFGWWRRDGYIYPRVDIEIDRTATLEIWAGLSEPICVRFFAFGNTSVVLYPETGTDTRELYRWAVEYVAKHYRKPETVEGEPCAL